jgi:K+-sensing histidine kinase KdpD
MFEADLARPTALLLGNEAWGLKDDTRELADASVRVPIQGAAESLNLAAAAALLLFEAARQRGGREDDLATLIGASVHDLRLPLTAIKGFASTLVDRWDDFEERARRELVSGMLLDLDRIASMITLLVDTARLERGGLPRPGERQNVAATLEGIAQVFDRSPDYPEVIVKGDAEARMEASRLQAVVLAMCEGAMWWGQSGPIEIEARTEGANAVIEVARGGGGPEDAEAVFSITEGSGGRITLHMARRVVESLGGTLTAEGGAGTRFRLSLPA